MQNRSAARGCLRSSSRFDDFECYGRSRAVARLLFEIDVSERLPVGVADDEAGFGFLGGPGGREAALGHGRLEHTRSLIARRMPRAGPEKAAGSFWCPTAAQQLRQLGDVGGDAAGRGASELGPRQRLPAHGEKSRRHDNVSAREETMRRREFIALMGASVTSPFAAMAQQAGRTYRLGGLSANPRNNPAFVAMFDELRRQGFIEGQNLTVEWRSYRARIDQVPEFVAELVNAHVDVIYVGGHPGIRAAQQATATIPILGITQDMVGQGLVNSLARPDGNTTGISILATELDGKRQEILIEAVRGLRRMAALADFNTTPVVKLDALQEAARARNIELSIHRVASAEEITAAIDTAKASGAAALNVLSSPILYGNRQLIFDRVAALRLPAIYPWAEEAEEGGFVAYGPRIVQIYRELLAQQLVKLFRGVKVADIPIEQPTNFELVINLKTAKAMGVTVPEALLVRADKVIE